MEHRIRLGQENRIRSVKLAATITYRRIYTRTDQDPELTKFMSRIRTSYEEINQATEPNSVAIEITDNI